MATGFLKKMNLVLLPKIVTKPFSFPWPPFPRHTPPRYPIKPPRSPPPSGPYYALPFPPMPQQPANGIAKMNLGVGILSLVLGVLLAGQQISSGVANELKWVEQLELLRKQNELLIEEKNINDEPVKGGVVIQTTAAVAAAAAVGAVAAAAAVGALALAVVCLSRKN